MPIKQDRMLSLLAAARDYQLAMEKFFGLASEARARVANGEITAAQALDSLAISVRPELLLAYPYESPTVILLESKHFARERKRNDRKAQKLRENREAERAGLPPPQRGNGSSSGSLGRERVAARLDDIRPRPRVTAEMPEANVELDAMGELDPGFAPGQGLSSVDAQAGETLRQQLEFIRQMEGEKKPKAGSGQPPEKGES